MSIQVNTDRDTFISGAIKGSKFNIAYDEETFNSLKTLSEDVATIEAKCATMDEFVEKSTTFYDTAEALVAVDYKATIASNNPYLHFNPQTEQFFLKVGSKVSNKALPKKFVEIIEAGIEKKLDIMPVIRLCKRFLMNPFFTKKKFKMLATSISTTYVDKEEVKRLMDEEKLSKRIATTRATYADKEITKEGYLRTYKVVEEETKKFALKTDGDGNVVIGDDGKPVKVKVDRYATKHIIDENTGEVTTEVDKGFLDDRLFKPAIRSRSNGDDFFCGDKEGWTYMVGQLHRLASWDMVSVKDNSAHEKGLHSGGLQYVESYRHRGELVDAFVCPSKIGKFTDDGAGEMTSLELFIHGSTHIEGITRNIYNASTYGKIQKAQFEEELAATIEANNKLVEEQGENLTITRATLSDLDLLAE